MSQPPVNPYAAPVAASELHTRHDPDGQLATLLSRFVGSIIDGVLLMAVVVPVLIGIVFGAMAVGADPDSLVFNVATTVLSVPLVAAAFLVINGHLLASRGQTVGKYLVKTQIVGDDGTIQPLMPMFFKRYLVLWSVAMIPYLGNLVGVIDSLFIFRGSRKCLHDDIAGTKVIKMRG